ncbi:MAG: PAS domain S-box protein [Desulfatibacillaceae bacterium]
MERADRIANELFLLMVNLSRVKSRDRIVSLFTEAMTGCFDGLEFAFHGMDGEVDGHVIEVSTPRIRLGRISITGGFGEQPPEIQALAKNAAVMLALVLENRHQEEELKWERDSLECTVKDRTTHLDEKNRELVNEIAERRRAEKSLRESERKYRELIEQAAEGVLVSLDGRIVLANPALENLFGLPASRLMGRDVAEFIHPDDLDATPWGSRGPEGPDVSGDTTCRLAAGLAGGQKWVEVRTSRIEWHGRPALFSLMMDVTARMEAEEARSRLAAIVNSSSNAVIGVDLEGIVHSWNPSAEQILGYPAGEIVGRHVSLIVPPERQDEYEWIMQTVRLGKAVTAVETERLTRDGRRLPVSLTATSIRDRDGRSLGISAIMRDITEERRMARELEESRREYQELYDYAPDMYITVRSGTGLVTRCNRTLLETLGYDKAQVVGREIDSLFAPSSARNAGKVHETWGSDRENANMELVLRARDGSDIDVMLSSTPVYDENGSVLAVRCAMRDITELKRATREKQVLENQLKQGQKMEAIGTLAGGIAHDFNNILGGMLGHAELALMSAPADTEVGRSLEEIRKASHRAKELIQQILTFSRRRQRDQASAVRLDLLAKETIRLLRASLPSTIAIRNNVRTGLKVRIDAARMQQVILNLCTNALHAMERDGGTLYVELSRNDPPMDCQLPLPEDSRGPFVELTVKDTGAGMRPDVLDRIFDPYFTTKERDKGTGLGLSVVHGIVKNHRGCIRVESMPGQGSEFRIYLPESVEEDQPGRDKASIDLPLGNERVLLVDDEPALAEVGRIMLEKLGYRPTVFEDPVKALVSFELAPDRYDLVITDQTMPGMTGKILGLKIRGISPDTPVMICTGYSEAMDELRASDLGFAAFLEKPLSMEQLAVALRKVLDSG